MSWLISCCINGISLPPPPLHKLEVNTCLWHIRLFSQCLGSLTSSLPSAASMNDIPTKQGKRFGITHYQTCPQLSMSKLSHSTPQGY